MSVCAIFYIYTPAFNLIAWSLDFVGDILSLVLRRQNFLLGMVMAMGVSSGLTPIVYIIGGWDVVTRATRVSSRDWEHKFSFRPFAKIVFEPNFWPF